MSTTKKEKAQKIARVLRRLYPHPPIPLKHKDPYTLLISVLLSAQCTDERVNRITPLLFQKADHPEAMIRLSVEEIREIIKPCGLSLNKSWAIHRLSQILIEEHGARVPRSFASLEALPGVGHKTASVVMTQAFAVPSFPVDTHIHRLAWRWGLSPGKNVVETEKNLKSLFPRNKWADLHLQIIYFGREHCPARGHRVKECPICSRHGRRGLKDS